MTRYKDTDSNFATALKLWMAKTHGMGPEHIDTLVYRDGRKWKAQFDWVVAFCQTPDYEAFHRARQEGDPFIMDVRRAIEALGNPQTFLLPQLATPHVRGRRIHAVLMYLGYEPNPNPKEPQGRWYWQGKQVKGYRRMS